MIATTNPAHVTALRLAEDGQRRCRAEIDDLAAQSREKRTELRDWDRKVSEAIDVLVGRAPASLFDAAEPPPDPVAPEPGSGPAVAQAIADLAMIDAETVEAGGLPIAVRAQGLALIGVPPAVLKKLDQFGEIATVGDLWDWVEEDRYDVGGMANANGGGLWACLKHIKVASQHIGPTVDAICGFLKAKGCDPRLKATGGGTAVDLDAPIAKPGDIVRTSYGTGPYIVKSVDRHGNRGGRPTFTIHCQPTRKGEREGGLINDLQRQPDGRITAKNGDEVLVLPAGSEPGPSYWDWSRPLGEAATANRDLQQLWMKGEPLPRTDKASGVLEAQGDASAWAGFIDPAQVPAVGDLPLCRVDGFPASIWQDLEKPLHKIKTIGDLAKKVEELNFAGDLGEQVYATIAQLLGRDGFLVTMARDAIVSLLRPASTPPKLSAVDFKLSAIEPFPEQAAAALDRKGITTLSQLQEYVVEEGTPLRTSAFAFLAAIPGISKPVAGAAADVIADLLETDPPEDDSLTGEQIESLGLTKAKLEAAGVCDKWAGGNKIADPVTVKPVKFNNRLHVWTSAEGGPQGSAWNCRPLWDAKEFKARHVGIKTRLEPGNFSRGNAGFPGTDFYVGVRVRVGKVEFIMGSAGEVRRLIDPKVATRKESVA